MPSFAIEIILNKLSSERPSASEWTRLHFANDDYDFLHECARSPSELEKLPKEEEGEEKNPHHSFDGI